MTILKNVMAVFPVNRMNSEQVIHSKGHVKYYMEAMEKRESINFLIVLA